MGWLSMLFGKMTMGSTADAEAKIKTLKTSLEEANERIKACEAQLRDCLATVSTVTPSDVTVERYQESRARFKRRFSLRSVIGVITILSVILGVYFSKKTEIDTYLWNRQLYKLEGQFFDQIDEAIDFDNGRRTEAEMRARKGKRIKGLDQQILEHEAKRPMARKRKGAQQNN
jgi:hypothetical protein